MLPSSVDSRGLLGPSPPGNAFLASSVSCFIWQQVSFVSIKFYLQKYEQPCVHIFVQYCSSSVPAFSIWIVTFSSSFLARPACAIFFWCGLPARWDSKVFKKARSKMWQQKKWSSYLLTGNCKLAHLTLDWNCLEWKIWAPQWHSACILLFSFSSSSTFVVAPWLFKRHTWVVWSFR